LLCTNGSAQYFSRKNSVALIFKQVSEITDSITESAVENELQHEIILNKSEKCEVLCNRSMSVLVSRIPKHDADNVYILPGKTTIHEKGNLELKSKYKLIRSLTPFLNTRV